MTIHSITDADHNLKYEKRVGLGTPIGINLDILGGITVTTRA